MLRQKAKLEWLRLGDGNNKYLQASIKAMRNANNMNILQTEDGTLITQSEEIEEEVLRFYKKLIGTAEAELNGIDIPVMRQRYQVSNTQREMLIAPISEQEIVASLNNINDMKSPGMDGYGAYFFKKAWVIVKHNVMRVVYDFFRVVTFIRLPTAQW